MLLLSGTYVKLFKNVTALISPLPLAKILLIYMLQKSRIALFYEHVHLVLKEFKYYLLDANWNAADDSTRELVKFNRKPLLALETISCTPNCIEERNVQTVFKSSVQYINYNHKKIASSMCGNIRYRYCFLFKEETTIASGSVRSL